LGKSRLSTAEMKRLKAAGIRLQMIAELAGITTMGVRYRLQPKKRQNGASHDDADGAYLAKQRKRQQDYQRLSLKYAKNFGEWTPREIRFLEKNASKLTVLELAIELERSYYAVNHFINRHGVPTRK